MHLSRLLCTALAGTAFGLFAAALLAQTPAAPPKYPAGYNPALPHQKATPRGNANAWVTGDDYSSFALEQEMQGSTRYRLTVSAAGDATDCTILRSSTYQTLDELTCWKAKRRARFYPATDAKKAPIVGTYEVTVRWRIPELAMYGPEFGPTPIAGPLAWITDNPWMNVPNKPKDVKTLVIDADRYFSIRVDKSGRVKKCTGINYRPDGLVNPDIKAMDAQICAQYKEKGRFIPAVDAQNRPMTADYFGHVPAKLLYEESHLAIIR